MVYRFSSCVFKTTKQVDLEICTLSPVPEELCSRVLKPLQLVWLFVTAGMTDIHFQSVLSDLETHITIFWQKHFPIPVYPNPDVLVSLAAMLTLVLSFKIFLNLIFT